MRRPDVFCHSAAQPAGAHQVVQRAQRRARNSVSGEKMLEVVKYRLRPTGGTGRKEKNPLMISRAQLVNQVAGLGAGYLALMLVMNEVLWDPATGAMTRVVLPMTVGFNVLLVQEPRGRFWPWFILGNLHVIPGFWVLPPL